MTYNSQSLPSVIAEYDFDERGQAFQNELDSLRTSIETAEKRIVQVIKDQRKLAFERSLAALERFKADTSVTITDLLDESKSETFKAYKAMCSLPGINATGGYWVATGQRALKLEMHRNRVGEVEATAEVLRLVLPFVIADEHGIATLGVNSGEWSRYHACFDSVTPDHCFLRYSTRSSSANNEQRFERIEDLLAFVQKNYCYGDDDIVETESY